jgi:hypothetical protein
MQGYLSVSVGLLDFQRSQHAGLLRVDGGHAGQRRGAVGADNVALNATQFRRGHIWAEFALGQFQLLPH